MSDDYQIFAVAGKPIIHSKSPVLFNSYFRNNKNQYYIKIANNTLKELIEIIKELPIAGVNITSPYKSSIIPYINECDEKAIQINAINLIKNINSELKGFNTDIGGVENSLLNAGVDLEGKNCLVVGAGGAASAAIYTAKSKGANVTVVNRTIKKANYLSEKFGCYYGSLDEFDFYVKDAEIIINTIPIDVLDLSLLNQNQILLNADYKKQIGNVDFKYIDGLKWLIEQAVASLKIFTNEEISSSVFEKYLTNEIDKKRENISLVGFAGSGKSVVGKLLAKKIGFDFIDTDLLIEQKTGEEISNIFRNKGEDYFRKIETELLLSLIGIKNTVIATGGGVVLSEENREILKNISDVFWIYSPIGTCYKRLSKSLNPPSFNIMENKKEDLNRFNKIFQDRLADYCNVSDVLFYNKSVEEVVDRIYYEINHKI